MAQHINLYDPVLQRQRDWLAPHYVAGAALVLALGVGTVGTVLRLGLPELAARAENGESQLKIARTQLATLGQQIAGRKPDPRLEQEIAVRRTLLTLRHDVLATLRQSVGPAAGSDYAEYLRGLARQTVAGLWLTDFAVDTVTGGMEIRGRMTDPALLPEYIRRLNREQAFRGRSFAALKLDAGKPDAAKAIARTPWHEFMLVPEKAAAKADAGRAG